MPDTLEPLSATASYFDALGVPVAVSEADLTRCYRELSRRYHPDRWATADAATQANALDSTALLNDAFRTLRDPFARAEYLLRRERGTRPDDNKAMAEPPRELFARVLELQEAIMEFQEARAEDDGATLERLRPVLAEAKAEFETAYAAMADRLHALFARWDAGEERAALLDQIAQVLGTRGYLRRVLANLDGTLG